MNVLNNFHQWYRRRVLALTRKQFDMLEQYIYWYTSLTPPLRTLAEVEYKAHWIRQGESTENIDLGIRSLRRLAREVDHYPTKSSAR